MAWYGRCTISGNIGTGEIFSFGWALASSSANVAADATALNIMVDNLLTSNYLSRVANSVTHTRQRVQSYDLSTGDLLETVDRSLSVVGTNVVQPLPNEVSMAVSIRTAEATRRGRGRFYLPPFGTDQIAGSVFTATCVTNVGIAVASAFNSWTSAALGQYIGLLRPPASGSFALQFRIATAWDIGNVPDSQRRRRNRQVEARSGGAIS